MLDLTVLCEKTLNAEILWALGDGKAYTLRELTKLLAAEEDKVAEALEDLRRKKILILLDRRFQYYRLMDLEMIKQLKGLNALLPDEHKKRIKIFNTSGIKYCRSCYDHLAGKVGVEITDALLSKHFLELKDEQFLLTFEGEVFFRSEGIDVDNLKRLNKPLVKTCLDFSERRYHFRGSLAAAYLNKMFENGWLQREGNSRIIKITAKGKKAFALRFGI